uniref:PBPe domain-containing protein n=1 Tax=Heterorhabditis bacteriophora TaxID=37862 RepID=A0A1I7XEF5_HETBA
MVARWFQMDSSFAIMQTHGQNNTISYEGREVGLSTEDYFFLGSLPAFRSRFGIFIQPSVAVLRQVTILLQRKRPFVPHLNIHEVSRTFWMPLELFLDNSTHNVFVLDNTYSVHSFSFNGAEIYGITAFMCIITAMMVLQRTPSFDINSSLTVSRMEKMALTDIIDHILQFVHLPFKKSKL